MTHNYKRELDALSKVYTAAINLDVTPVTAIIGEMICYPVLTIGSGGSFSTASFSADLHQRRTGQLARSSTPLELLSETLPHTAVLFHSASGRNRDIGAAFKYAAQAEPGPIGALVLSEDTPLHGLQRRFGYTNVTGISHESFRDGFLAVASMIASSILMTRTYNQLLGSINKFPSCLEAFLEQTVGEHTLEFVSARVNRLLHRDVISLLYSPIARSAAVDLESRFVEAALGPIHIADFRNFGHGRHHWVAKRSENTGVLALVGERDLTLAERTLGLLPDEIPVARIDLRGPPDHQSIAALFVGLFISEAAGRICGIDPGKPGVPKFGRRLYGLGPGPLRRRVSEENQRTAIRRKAPEALHDEAQYEVWKAAYLLAVEKLNAAQIGGIVFDYDGTLCDGRQRFDPLLPSVCTALRQLHAKGMGIGVATGRGTSAGEALRKCFNGSARDDVYIGYYNGAVITTLSNVEQDLIGPFGSPKLLDSLSAHPLLESAEIRSNAAQISLRIPPPIGVSTAIPAVDAVLSQYGLKPRITSSGHSIDIQFSDASKNAVVDQVQASLPDDRIVLRIGDKGNFLGNDAELLASPYGISVDEASRDFRHCWALAPAGIKGVQATLYYLSKLEFTEGIGRLLIRPGDRGGIYAS